MTKSMVMPTAILRGAPDSMPALTYNFLINNPDHPECYTIGFEVDRLTLTYVSPPSCIGK